MGRATRYSTDTDRSDGISIHALRGEGDDDAKAAAEWATDFNPRPPWGGRLYKAPARDVDFVISIHALRGEGDFYNTLCQK